MQYMCVDEYMYMGCIGGLLAHTIHSLKLEEKDQSW